MLSKTIGELYDYCTLHYGHKTAIVFGEERYTFSELKEKGTRLANSLLRLGLLKGDKLAILMPNSPEVIFADYACAQTGVVRVPLAAYLQLGDMLYILRDTGARAMIYHQSFMPFVEKIKKELPQIEHFICASDGPADLPGGDHHLHSLLTDGPLQEIPATVSEDDLAVIIYTGGTTGAPKGVVHNHRTFGSAITVELLDFGLGNNEVYLAATPLTHASGALVVPVFLKGGSCVIVQGFDPEKFLEITEKERVTTSFVVPTMIYGLLNVPDPKKYDLSSLRNIIYGAAPIAPESLKEAVRTFGPVFTQIYGQTEAPMALTVLPREEHIVDGDEVSERRLASCGRPTMATRLKLLDEDGNEIPAGQPGEIVAKSPLNMLRYHNRPDLTAETLKDGWLRTGDIARQDEEGYLYIVDRAKDMIVSGGFNIFPKEIEDALHEHPAVGMAAVVGVPDEKWGEAVKAVVVTRPGQSTTEEELISFCKEKKGRIMAPKSIDFRESIPLTPLGKPDKKAIREEYWSSEERRVR